MRFLKLFAWTAAMILFLWFMAGQAVPHSNPWLLTWIAQSCCVTNDCCWEVNAADLQSLPDDNWRVLASGSVLKRTGWSPDGRYYRCACDQIDGKWTVHPTAFTRCIFVPQMGS